MAYKALYRTYRPGTFDEVAGQQHIVKTLKNALATGKIAHAYLFTGPRGTGKTTMAKILAKALNCEEGIGCQCNECKNCRAIIDGSHPDVLEIDAASNNGVDEVRDLIDKVKYGTLLGRYKVYIIDEVHMMTPGAFNALLKTLEEPPEHVIFILATTEPHKILPTILSRCQRYDFSKLSHDEISDRLHIVLEKEGIEFNQEAIDLIVSLADGGMRDALSILDQVLAYSGNKLNVEDILSIFSLESTDEKISLIKSILNNNVSDVLSRLSTYISKGTDIKRLTDDLLMILKDVLIYQSTNNTSYTEILKDAEVREMSSLIDRKKVIEMVSILMDTLKDYKNVTAIAPLFQVTLLKLATLTCESEQEQVAPVVVNKSVQKPVYEAPKPAPAPTPVTPVVQEEVEPVEDKSFAFDNITVSANPMYINGTKQEDSFAIDDALMIEIMVASKKEIKKDLLDNWNKLQRLIAHPTYGKIATILKDSRPLVAGNKMLIIEHQLAKMAETLNLISNQGQIQAILENVFGKKMFVYTLSRNDSVRLQQAYLNRLQLGTLPKLENINLEFLGD